MKEKEVLKTLMLGLIYPAVLGNIIYIAIQELTKMPFEANIFHDIKLLFLLITLVFYFCDYLYISFTKDFGWFFFICDVAFIVFLYITVYSINIGKSENLKIETILSCYLAFMGIYLIWDFIEFLKNKSKVKESSFYKKIIGWEIASMTGLSIAYYYHNVINVAFVIIALITLCFVYFTLKKKELYFSKP
ncbi:MAG: hypothetical protein WA584_09620 [Pyrinomonadaceae bacterium]